jgi:hypothetical protein
MHLRAVVCCALLAGCGSKDKAPTPEPGSDKPAPPVDAGRAVAAKPPAPAKLLLPKDVDPGKPMPITELHAALDVWKEGTRIQVAGYPKFFIGDTGAIGTKIELGAAAGGTRDTKTLVECHPKTAIDTEVANSKPVVVEGALYGGVWGKDDKRYIWLSDCVLISSGTAFDAEAPPDPRSGKPIPIQKLYDVYVGWQDTEVSVAGYYQGITTSSSVGGAEVIDVRVDLATTDLKVLLGCHLAKQKPDEALVAKLDKDRANTIVRGKVTREAFGYPQLDPCVITNR